MSGTNPTDGPLRVLLVEDNDWDARTTLESAAKAEPSLRMVRAAALDEARALLDREAFDVILTDLNLPDSKGTATVTALRAARPEIPLVALTGSGDRSTGLHCVQLGAQDFLEKAPDGLPPDLASKLAFAVTRARLAADLAASAGDLEQALKELGDYVVTSDLQGRVLRWNEPFSRVMGGDGAVAKAAQTGDPRMASVVQHGLAELAAGRPVVREVTMATPNGERQVLWNAAPIRDASGAIKAAVAIGRDVTDIRRMDAERMAARDSIERARQLEETDRERRRFINLVAHELNNPLTPIRLQLAIANAHKDSLDARTQKVLDVVGRNTERLARLVGDLLDIGRLQSGKMRINARPTDLAALCLEFKALFEPQAKAKGIAIEFLPRPPCTCVVDPDRFAQILINLVSNAIKFTDSGGKVTVAGRMVDGGFALEVTDTGRGMDAQQLADLFRPFAQVHEDSASQGGLGLGLFISKGIVEGHGGTLTVTSPGLGKGSTFRAWLPAGGHPPAAAPAG